MCVDTRVIPIALSEHTHSSHSSHSPTYGVRVCLAYLRARVRARAWGYRYVCVSPMRVATAYLSVRLYTQKNFTTLNYLSCVSCVFICCAFWLCLRIRCAIDSRLLWCMWCVWSACDSPNFLSNSIVCVRKNISQYYSVCCVVLCCAVCLFIFVLCLRLSMSWVEVSVRFTKWTHTKNNTQKYEKIFTQKIFTQKIWKECSLSMKCSVLRFYVRVSI